MRRYLVPVLILILLPSAAGCAGFGGSDLDRVTEFVLENEAVLRQTAADCENGTRVELDGVQDIRRTLEGVIRFQCGAGGISVSSYEYGFYYSSGDVPVNCYGYPWDELEEDGEGYSFEGSYIYYTKKICDGFWFYSAND